MAIASGSPMLDQTRVAAADPIPEAEHPRRLDAELRHLVELGRDGGEMVADRRFAHALRRSRRARSRALVIVSCVVKVFDETMNSVRDGSSPRSVSPMSAPSTLETKWLRSCGGAKAPRRASPWRGRGRSRRCRY